jgi:two-component system, NarL family, response regulator NreC
LSAIRAVARGTVYLSQSITEQVVKGYVAAAHAPSPRSRPLAPREVEILRRIASGESTKEIAFALRLGTKTVETHRRRIMEKLNRFSVAELTQYAVAESLIPLASSVEA